jgi:RNA polymerase sigma-B factor
LNTLFSSNSSTPAASTPDSKTLSNELVMRYRGLVHHLAIRYRGCNGAELEDLRQVGYLGLLLALKNFEPGLGKPIEPFLAAHVRGAMLHYLRDQAAPVRLPQRLGSRSRPSSVAAQVRHSWWQWQFQLKPLETINADQVPMDPDADAYRQLVCIERRRALGRALGRLDAPQRRCVEAVLLAGQSLRQVALRERTSAMTIHRRLRSALVLLRQELSPLAS